MYLIKKNNFEFVKILESGYSIKEGNNQIRKKQFANGKRKKILTSYKDCVIKIKLGGLDSSDFINYYNALTDGEYTYYSFNDMEYKRANFIVDKPEVQVNRMISTTNFLIDDFEITLEKSSDVDD